MFCHSVDIFFMYCLISSVFIMTMMGSFSSSLDSDVRHRWELTVIH